jgi:hypothetical protein
VQALAGPLREEPEERDCERQPPESGCDRADIGEPNEPWAECERDVAEKQSREGEWMRIGASHARRLGGRALS